MPTRPRRTTTTCLHCSYRWPTRVQNPEEVNCPRCSQRANTPPPPPPPPIEVYLPRTPKDGKTEAEKFVKYLGCWTFVNHRDAVRRRDLDDYRDMLLALIKVNKTRHDNIGRWETAAAKETLATIAKYTGVGSTQ